MNYLTDHGEIFLSATCQTIRDMFGCECSSHENVEEKRVLTDKNFQVVIFFTGTIQGEYILAMQERTAARILGMADENTSKEELHEMRSEFSDAFSEALNVVVGKMITILGQDYKQLSFASARINFGTSIYPFIPTAKGRLSCDFGDVECHFYLNLMKLDISTSYHETLENYRKVQLLAGKVTKTISRIMNNISSGIFTIDENLIVHPGYSAATRGLLDLESTDEPVYFGDVLNNLAQDTRTVEGFLPWVKVIYGNRVLDWHKDILPICNCNEIATKDGHILQFTWVPIYKSPNDIDRIMAIVDDITEKRALDQVRTEMGKKQERNLALISVLMNLEPEEVMTFLEETRSILSYSKKLSKHLSYDRAYRKILAKNLKVIEEGAAQYNFTELENAVAGVEREFARIDNAKQTANDARILKQEIDKLQSLLMDIEHISNTVTEDSKSAPDIASGLRIPFEKITNLEKQILTLNINPTNGNLVETLLPLVHNLRRTDLFSNFETLKSMLEKMASRLSKRILLTCKGNVEVDIEVVRKVIDPMIQVLRNAVEYGIETMEAREALNKNSIGILEMSAEVNGDFVTLRIQDDGKGIDADAIAQSVVAKKLLSLEKTQELSTEEKLHLIFYPGFSTFGRDEINISRGLGLGMVKDQIEELGGVVDLETTLGKGTTFKLSFPISSSKKVYEVNDEPVYSVR